MHTCGRYMVFLVINLLAMYSAQLTHFTCIHVAPTFVNSNGQAIGHISKYNCYQYVNGPIAPDDQVTMTVYVVESNVTLTWTVTSNGRTHEINGCNQEKWEKCDHYVLKHKNKVIVNRYTQKLM